MDAIRIGRIQPYLSLGCPILAAFIAMRKNRSSLKWVLLTFFMPMFAPAVLVPMNVFFPNLRIFFDYGVCDELIRLLSGPLCILVLLFQPDLPSTSSNKKRDLIVALLWFLFVALSVMILAVLFFPRQH
jgi:hypothetical protein